MEPRLKWIKWCDKTIEFSFYGLIFFLPMSTAILEAMSTVIFSVFFVKRVALFIFFLRDHQRKSARALPAIEIFGILKESFRLTPGYLNLPVLIFILFNLISVFFSLSFSLSIKGFIGKVIQGTFLFFTFV